MEELDNIIFEDKGTNYRLLINDYIVDAQIYNAAGLSEFMAKYNIFRDKRLKELDFFIQKCLNRVPEASMFLNVTDFIESKFITVIKEKNLVYRVDWPSVPSEWAGKKYFIIRNYSKIGQLNPEDMNPEDPAENIFYMLLAPYETANPSENLLFESALIPEDMQNQNEILILPQGAGGSYVPPALPSILPFEDDGADKAKGITFYY